MITPYRAWSTAQYTVSMKKIVFVQKEDSSAYDPVTAFFAHKKPPTPAKPPPPIATEAKSIKKGTKTPAQKQQDKSHRDDSLDKQRVQEQIQGQQRMVPIKVKPIKDQKSTPNMRAPVKQTKPIPREQPMARQTPKEMKEAVYAEERQESKQVKQLLERIKDLQQRIEQYEKMIAQYEEKEQKYFKCQQKLQRLLKQSKSNALRQKQYEQLTVRLCEREAQLKQLLQSPQVPYSKKREVLLHNQMASLRRTNTQLVLRLKNYRGSDLSEMAMHQTHSQIQTDYQMGKTILPPLNLQMESLHRRLLCEMQEHIRSKAAGPLPWPTEHKHLLKLVNLSQQISLLYLSEYSAFPLPSTEAQCLPLLAKAHSRMQGMLPLADRLALNLTIGQHNANILLEMEDNSKERAALRLKSSTVSNDKVRIYEVRCNYTESILVEAICQMEAMQGYIKKMCSKINQEMSKLGNALDEMGAIFEAGNHSGKEALFLFISQNIEKMRLKQRTINLDMRELLSAYSDVQKYV